jgi:rubrerythrin
MEEQQKTLEALKTAIKMEVDGKAFYLEASGKSTNKLGKELLKTLAGEEDTHRRKFEEIYKAIQSKKNWPATSFRPDGGKKLRTVFAQATEKMTTGGKALDTELEAIKTAMDMENQTYDFYKRQSQSAAFTGEKDFYELVAGEESEHHSVLLDYYEYLKDPAGWFVKKEHPSLDGG